MTYIILFNILISILFLLKNIRSKKALTYILLLLGISLSIFSVIAIITKLGAYQPYASGLISTYDLKIYLYISSLRIVYRSIASTYLTGVVIYLMAILAITYSILKKRNSSWHPILIFLLGIPVVIWARMSTFSVKYSLYLLSVTNPDVVEHYSNFWVFFEKYIFIHVLFILILPIAITIKQHLHTKTTFVKRQNASIILSLTLMNFTYYIFFLIYTPSIVDSVLSVKFSAKDTVFYTLLPTLMILSANLLLVSSIKNNVVEPLHLFKRIIFNIRIKQTAKDFRGYFHSYKNDFFIMKILAEQARTECVLDSTKDTLNQIINRADHALDDMDEILDFFRPIHPTRKCYHLHDSIQKVLASFTQEQRQFIRYEIENEILDIALLDKKLFEDALYNIIDNATDAVSEISNKEIAVRLENENEYIIISIKDNGKGMSKKTMKSLFKPFSSSKNQFSWGIGLNYAYRIIKANQGFILCESTLGQGTEFQIIFQMMRGSNDK